MELPEILRRIEQRLAELGISENEASLRSGHRDAIRNIRRAIAKGKGAPTTRVLTDLASVLETSQAWLLEGNSGHGDPYDAVLAELRTKRDQIDQAIKIIEAERGTRKFSR